MKKLIVTGYVGQDPQIKITADGREIVKFSLAYTSTSKNKNTNITDWIEIICNNDNYKSFALQHIKKGAKLLVEGFPSVYAYINKENKPVAVQSILVNLIEFISSKSSDNNNINNSVNVNGFTQDATAVAADLDIPF